MPSSPPSSFLHSLVPYSVLGSSFLKHFLQSPSFCLDFWLLTWHRETDSKRTLRLYRRWAGSRVGRERTTDAETRLDLPSAPISQSFPVPPMSFALAPWGPGHSAALAHLAAVYTRSWLAMPLNAHLLLWNSSCPISLELPDLSSS